MKTNYTFVYIDLFSIHFMINLPLIFLAIGIYFALSLTGKSSFLGQTILNLKHQPFKVQQLIVKIQKLLRWLTVVNSMFLNFFIISVVTFYGPAQIIGLTPHRARIRYLTEFNQRTLLELAKKDQFDYTSALAQTIRENDRAINTILENQIGQPSGYLNFFVVILVFLIFYRVLLPFFESRKLSIVLIVRVDLVTPFLIPFLFVGVLTFVVTLMFQTFFVRQFFLFFSTLNTFQKIKFLKLLRLFLVVSLIVNIMFPLVLGCLFFHTQAIEVAQLNHLYEVQQLLHTDMQAVLSELLEKQKLYLPHTIEYQNITSLINLTQAVIENQKLILTFFERKYLFSVDQVNNFSYQYVILARILISGLFGLGFLVLAYKAYQLSNIKK